MNDPLLGRRLDEYRLDALLGQGGMARVYRGVDVRLGRPVAIKVIDTPYRAEADYIQRFEQEARAVAQLDHPHIVRLYRFGEADGLLYMAMQYIAGGDLGQVLAAHRQAGTYLPARQVIALLREIGQALDYAHAAGVIHRDVKPTNILLDGAGRAVLTDFGLALLALAGTRGKAFGSPHYIAPEQALSSAGAVPASDLYSLGVIAYELLTGHVPFSAESALDLALMHVREPVPSPRVFRPALGPHVEAALLRALAKTPAERYPSGAALSGALEQALQADPSLDDTVPRQRPVPETMAQLAIPRPPRADAVAASGVPDTGEGVPVRRAATPTAPAAAAPAPVPMAPAPLAVPAVPAAGGPVSLSHPTAVPIYPAGAAPPGARGGPLAALGRPAPLACAGCLGLLLLAGVALGGGWRLLAASLGAATATPTSPAVTESTSIFVAQPSATPSYTPELGEPPAVAPTPVPTETVPPSPTPTATDTVEPSPTATDTPAPTETETAAPTATATPQVVRLSIARRGDDAIFIANAGDVSLPLLPLQVRGGRDEEVEGEDWDREDIEPDECVAIVKGEGNTDPDDDDLEEVRRPEDFECELVGDLPGIERLDRFITPRVDFYYAEEPVGSCDKDDSRCEVEFALAE